MRRHREGGSRLEPADEEEVFAGFISYLVIILADRVTYYVDSGQVF